jgi:radical SAM superfamily enzyme YgiQ (UPF0313 family)
MKQPIANVLLVRTSSAVDKVDHPQFFDPCYQLKYIEAELVGSGGVSVHSHDCWIEPASAGQLAALAQRVQPDLVVISSSSFDVDVSNELAAALKRWETPPLILGIGHGQHLNHDTQNPLDRCYDAILMGEPEEEFRALFAALRADAGPEAAWRAHYRKLYEEDHRFVVQDLEALPFPQYTREELHAYRSIYPVRLAKRVLWGFMIAGRGCPYSCSFCSEVMRVSVGRKMRIRSAKSVVDEMEGLVRQGANIVSFQDDSFASSPHLVKTVCAELMERKARIPWMARVRVDDLDYDLLKLMRDAGCVMLGIGVEAGSQRMIDRVVKTYKPKPWVEIARQVFKWTRELGIGTNAYYVLGSPTETREELEQTVQLALELNADSIQVHFHTPYPGSPDWKAFREVFEDYDPSKMFHYAEPLFSLAAVTPSELMEVRSSMYRRYLFRPGFALRHMWHYGLFYLFNPDIFWTLLGIRKLFRSPKRATVERVHEIQPQAPKQTEKDRKEPRREVGV